MSAAGLRTGNAKTRRRDSAEPGVSAAATLSVGQWLRERTTIYPLLVVITLGSATLLNPIQPVTGERTSFGNPILLMRLATAGFAWAIGLWGFVQKPSARRLLHSLPGWLLVGLSLAFLVSSCLTVESTRMISFASALILGGYLLLLASAVATLGLAGTLWATLGGSIVYLVIAWVVFLLFPSVGKFYEYTDATSTVVRMGGVAHPNAIAREAAAALLIFLGLLRLRPRDSGDHSSDAASRSGFRWFVIAGIVGLILATLVGTISRTAILAGAVGASMLFFDRLCSRFGAALVLSGFCALLSVLLYAAMMNHVSLDSSATALLTKSGDLEELTSLTGRTRIWAEAAEWISRRPITGFGLDSAASVMSKDSVGTHSLILHVVFSGGLLAGIFLVPLLALTSMLAFFSREPLFRGLATYVFVSGLVEDTLFPSFPGQLTLAFLTVLLAISRSGIVSRWSPGSTRE